MALGVFLVCHHVLHSWETGQESLMMQEYLGVSPTMNLGKTLLTMPLFYCFFF